MADKKKIGASIVLDGEKEFKSAVTECNKKLTSMRSELGLVKEKYAENANSLEALSAKHDVLSKTLQIQKEKLDATRVGYENAVSSQKKVENGLSQLKSSYQVAQEKMEQMKRSADVTDKELDQQEKLMKELSDAIKKGEDNYKKATDRIDAWKNKLNTAETQVIRANRAVKQNSEYIDEAKNSTDNCAVSIDKYGKKVKVFKAEVSTFKDSLKSNIVSQAVISGVRELASAIKSVGESAVNATKDAAAYADDINTLATQTGLSTDTLQELKYMEDLVDVSLDQVTGSMAKNIKSMSKVKAGSETYVKAYKKLGVSVTNANGQLRDSEDVYWDVIDALGDVKNETERNATAMTIFGKSAQDLNPLIAQGSEGINKFKKEAREMGAVLDEDTLTSLNATNDQFDRMKQQSAILQREVGSALAPSILKGASAIGSAIQENKSDLIDLAENGIDVVTEGLTWIIDHSHGVVAALSAMATAATGIKVGTSVAGLVGGFEKIASYATPIGAVVGVITALTGAVTLYSIAQQKQKTATQRAAEEAQKETKALEEKRKEIQNTIDVSKENLSTTTKECETVQNLTDRLKQLNPIQNKTAAQKAEIQRISEQLKDKIPEIAASYDKETGSIKLTNNQLTRLADNYVNVAMQAAAAKQVQDAANAAFEAEMKLNDAKSKAKTTNSEMKKAEQLYKKVKAEMEKEYGNINKLVDATRNPFNFSATKMVEELTKAEAGYNDAKKAANSAANEVKKYQNTIDDANGTIEKATKLRDKYAKKLEISGAKEKNNGDNSKKAAQEYEKLSETFNTAMSKMGKSGYKVSKNIGVEFDKTVKVAKQTGTKIPKGLAMGLKNGSKSPETAVLELKQAINKNLLKLASGARKHGAYIPEKLTEGISANKEDPIKAYEQINKEIKRIADSQLKKLNKVGINISDGMRKSFEKGGQNALDAISEANAMINKLMNTAGVNSVQGLINGVNAKKPAVVKAYMDLGDAADKAFKKRLDIHSPSRVFKKSGVHTVDGLIKGIESRKANLKKKANELGEILITKVQNKIDMKELKTNGHGYTETTIAKFWKGVVKATKKGTSAHTEALKKYYEARNDLKNKKNEILKDYGNTYKEYLSNLKTSIRELNQAYKESVNSTKQSIMSSYSLFSDVKITKTDDANGLIVNLKRQVDAIDSWRKNLQKLRDRGVSKSLISEIEALGVTSAGDVETLANMSDKQLKQYQSYYNKKNSLAEAEAKKENEALKKQTDSKIKKLDAKFSKKIANLTKKRNREMKALGLSLAKKFTEGIISGSSSAQKAIENMTGQKGKKVKKSSSSSKSISGKIKEYSSSKFVSNAIAGYSGLGYVQNLQKETRNLTDIIRKSLPTKDSIPSATARVNKGVVNNPNAEPVQLNLLMDSKMVASATFNHLDLMQGANIRLLQRGVSR